MEQDETRRAAPPRFPLRSPRSIWVVIGVFAALLLAAIWTAVYLQSRLERSDAVAAAVRANQNRAVAFEQYVVRTLESADMALIELIHGYGLGYGTPANPRKIDALSLRSAQIAAVSVVDAAGFVVASSIEPLRPNFNVASNEAFRAHADRKVRGPYISTPFDSRQLGRKVINITRRINRSEAEFLGVVTVSIYPETLVALQNEADVSANDLMSVIGEDGITRARRTGSRLSSGEDLNGLPVMAFHRRYPNGTYTGPGGLDGVWRYFSHRTLKDYPLFVTVGVARDEVLADSGTRQNYYIGAALLLSLLILACALLLGSYIRRGQKAAAELAEAIERLHEAQRIANIGYWEYDLESGRIGWSDQVFAMYGRDPAEGPPSFAELLSYYDDQGRASVQRAVRAATRTGEPQEHEQNVYLADGRVTYHQAVVVPTLNAVGKVVRLHGTAQDVSARKLLETLQTKLSHLSRIDAMNTMAATLAHELNQPLTAAANYMAGTKRLTEKMGPEAGMLRDGLGGAEKQLLLAGNIIRRVRDMISDRTARSERVKLSDVVNDALALVAMSRTFPETEVKLDLKPEADMVLADPVQIQQVLINLIRNACDAMEGCDGSSLAIATRREGAEDVRICVSDTGRGIPASVADLFSTFTSSKSNGLGIGLSISRTIVEAHGGRIWVESTGPEGTAICFTLPAAPAEAS